LPPAGKSAIRPGAAYPALAVLHQHLQDQMALALDHLSDIVMQRVREGLSDALAETVERAVAEEMARFSSSKK
jgi:hypothetical protein